MLRRFLFVPILLAAVVLVALLTALGPKPEAREIETVLPEVRAARVRVGPHRVTVSADGAVRPARRTTVAAEVAGQVVWGAPGLRDGVRVEEGAPLFRIEPLVYEQAVIQAQSQLERVRLWSGSGCSCRPKKAWRASRTTPPFDSDVITVQVSLPPGSSANATAEVVGEVEAAILRIREEVRVDHGVDPLRNLTALVGQRLPFGPGGAIGGAIASSGTTIGQLTLELIAAEERVGFTTREIGDRLRSLTGSLQHGGEVTILTSLLGEEAQQNNRHMMDIFFPAGLRGTAMVGSGPSAFVSSIPASGACWRIPDEWDRDAWGIPLSAAHLGFAISVFSKRLLDFSRLLGAEFNDEEGQSILDVWRYAGYVMGIPETILYSSAEDADRTYQTAYLCEPPPDEDSIAVANMLIQAIPAVADVEGEAAQAKLRGLAYRLSRALIGEDLAGAFHFPPRAWWDRATLLKYRTKQRFLRTLKGSQKVRAHNFTQLLQISVYDDDGVSYKMPDHVKTTHQSPW